MGPRLDPRASVGFTALFGVHLAGAAPARGNVPRASVADDAICCTGLTHDATQTSLCAYLSAIALAGVALNAFAGWWWADPIAMLAMVPIIAREGVEGLRGEAHCHGCSS